MGVGIRAWGLRCKLRTGRAAASTEPCLAEPGETRHDVTLFLSAWGAGRDRLAAIEPEWRALLERLYPDGVTV